MSVSLKRRMLSLEQNPDIAQKLWLAELGKIAAKIGPPPPISDQCSYRNWQLRRGGAVHAAAPPFSSPAYTSWLRRLSDEDLDALLASVLKHLEKKYGPLAEDSKELLKMLQG